MSILNLLSTILYMAEHKSKKKKNALSRLKIKTISFYIYPQFSSTEFFNEFIAPESQML